MPYPAWIVAVMLVFLTGVCYWISRTDRQEKSLMAFFQGIKPLSGATLTLNVLASQLAGSMLLGCAEEAYLHGWVVLLLPLGLTFALLFHAFHLGKGVLGKGPYQLTEVFYRVYGSLPLKLLSSCILISGLAIHLVAEGVAARKFLHTLGFDQGILFGILWGLMLFYTTTGGFFAVVRTDLFQSLFILGSLLFAIGYAFLHAKTVVVPHFDNGNTTISWTSWLFLPCSYLLLVGDQRYQNVMTKSRKSAFMLAACGMMLLMGVAIYFGVQAGSLHLTMHKKSSVFMEAVSAFTCPWIALVCCGALFMAILSTADSLICQLSALLTKEIGPLTTLPQRWGLLWARFITLTVGGGAFFLSYYFDEIVLFILLSYELVICLLLVPFVMGIFRSNPSKSAALLSVLFGMCGMVCFRLWPIPLPKEIAAVMLSFGGFEIGQWVQSRRLETVPSNPM